MNKSGKALLGISVFSAGAILSTGSISYWLFDKIMRRDCALPFHTEEDTGGQPDGTLRKAGRDWAICHRQQCTRLCISNKGVSLVGYYYDMGFEKTAILVHGFTGDYLERLWSAPIYEKQGFNLLTVECRGYGESSGRYKTLGYWDCRDVVCWAKHLADKKKQSQIILDGSSMGAAAVLSASGEKDLPGQVAGIVADSSYTTIYDMLAYQIRKTLKLPVFPFLNLVEWYCKKLCGISMIARSPLDSVKRAELPILLIHGVDDVCVPYEMCRELKLACHSPVKVLAVKGAGHGEACLVAPDEYKNRLVNFLKGLD